MQRSFDATLVGWIGQNLFDAEGNWDPGSRAILDGAWTPEGDIITEFEARQLCGSLDDGEEPCVSDPTWICSEMVGTDEPDED